jgi:hypothetical protein
VHSSNFNKIPKNVNNKIILTMNTLKNKSKFRIISNLAIGQITSSMLNRTPGGSKMKSLVLPLISSLIMVGGSLASEEGNSYPQPKNVKVEVFNLVDQFRTT